MKYHELITACNRVCNGVDKSSSPITKQMCMNYIHLAIKRYLKFLKDNGDDYISEKIKSDSIVRKYRTKLIYGDIN